MGLLNVPGLAGAKGELFPVVPAGKYEATLTLVEEVTTKDTGKPMLKITFTLNSEGEHQGRKLITYIILPNEKDDDQQNNLNTNRIKRLVTALKIELGGDELETTDLIGRSCLIMVKTKVKPNEPERNEVYDYIPMP